jgi:sulfur-oxidizing protein SoxY
MKPATPPSRFGDKGDMAKRRSFETKLTRREALTGGAALLTVAGAPLPVPSAWAEFEDAHDAMKSVLGVKQPKTGRVSLTLPNLVEDGSTVPITLSVESPMTVEDHVKRIHVFPDKNPTPFAATFYLGPGSGKAQVSSRIRLGESQTVIAVAELSDGSAWMTASDVSVTAGGCGGVVSDAEPVVQTKTRIKLPEIAERGQVIQIKTMITHPMESGHRTDAQGNPVPRKIINRFLCRYDGTEVFSADFHPSIAANPRLFFHIVATHSGPLTLKWIDDDGSEHSEMAEIEVT